MKKINVLLIIVSMVMFSCSNPLDSDSYSLTEIKIYEEVDCSGVGYATTCTDSSGAILELEQLACVAENYFWTNYFASLYDSIENSSFGGTFYEIDNTCEIEYEYISSGESVSLEGVYQQDGDSLTTCTVPNNTFINGNCTQFIFTK